MPDKPSINLRVRVHETPYIGFSNEQLDDAPEVPANVLCPNCGDLHEVQQTFSESKTSSMEWVRCPANEKAYMVGADGKLVVGIKPAVSGTL
jgi:hypothetical protein